jgi:hypothetical protein
VSYLWDKKGDGDADLRELESKLGGQRFGGMQLPRQASRRPLRAVGLGLVAFAAAAAVLVVLRPTDAVTFTEGAAQRRLGRGEWLETKPGVPVTLTLAREIGVVEVRGDSRVRVQRVDAQQQRLELARGQVHAVVTAPPRLFVVDTPSATAVDLGCEYTLEVTADGGSRLDVLSGKVVLEGAGRSTTVLAGMWALARPGVAPQVAIDRHASPAFVSAVQRLATEPEVLELVLSQAGVKDAVTLWQLRTRVPAVDGERLEARLRELLNPPENLADDGLWSASVAARGSN